MRAFAPRPVSHGEHGAILRFSVRDCAAPSRHQRCARRIWDLPRCAARGSPSSRDFPSRAAESRPSEMRGARGGFTTDAAARLSRRTRSDSRRHGAARRHEARKLSLCIAAADKLDGALLSPYASGRNPKTHARAPASKRVHHGRTRDLALEPIRKLEWPLRPRGRREGKADRPKAWQSHVEGEARLRRSRAFQRGPRVAPAAPRAFGAGAGRCKAPRLATAASRLASFGVALPRLQSAWRACAPCLGPRRAIPVSG